MKIPCTIGFVMLVALAAVAEPMAGEDDMYGKDHAAWRAERLEDLKAPQGWLRLVGLLWLKDGVNTIGAAEGSDVRFPEGAPPRVGTIAVEDGKYLLALADGVEATRNGDAFNAGPLATYGGPEEPADLIVMERFSFTIIIRNDKPAVRLWDAEATTLRGFQGIEAFPLDPAWRVEARYEAFEQPKIVEVSTAISTTQSVTVPGRFHFQIEGRDLTLDPFDYPGAEGLYLMFGDKTNGKTSYGGGRFVIVPRPDGDGASLDFNRAYNPPCAYSAYATCPLPRRENRLPIPVTAGEKFIDPDHL